MSPHQHGRAAVDDQSADTRLLGGALMLIVVFMGAEVVVGLWSGSLALLTDAAHMLTDAAAIALALVAARLASRPARGNFTFGLRRVEILSAQANGLTLWLLAVWFVYQGVGRLIDPPDVDGGLVLVTALVGVAVNLFATWLISRANRTSLNVEGAFQHILNDLFAFIVTAIAGAVVLATGWVRADAVAALVVAALMAKGGWGLIRDAWRIFLEAAPSGIDVEAIDADLHTFEGVVEIHDCMSGRSPRAFPHCRRTSWLSHTATATSAAKPSATCWASGTGSSTPPSRSTTPRSQNSSLLRTSSIRRRRLRRAERDDQGVVTHADQTKTVTLIRSAWRAIDASGCQRASHHRPDFRRLGAHDVRIHRNHPYRGIGRRRLGHHRRGRGLVAAIESRARQY